jgi:hypothetical protein
MTRARDVANIDGVLTTTGDTYYASAAATPARLGIGSTGQVLTVAGGVPSWATASSGGMTLLSTTSLSGSSTTISSISGSYTDLQISIENADITGTTGFFRIAPNGTTSASNCAYVSNTNTLTATNNSYIFPVGILQIQTGTTKNNSVTTIYNYASTANNKSVMAAGNADPTTAGQNAGFCFGSFVSTSAITSIVISTPSGTMSGTVKVYGVK